MNILIQFFYERPEVERRQIGNVAEFDCIHEVTRDPHCLLDQIQALSVQEGSARDILSLFEVCANDLRPQIVEGLLESALLLPTSIQNILIEEASEVFFSLFEQRYPGLNWNSIILSVRDRVSDNWSENFFNIFKSLKFKENGLPASHQPAGNFAIHLLKALSEEDKFTWLEYCCQEAEGECLAFLLIILESEVQEATLLYLQKLGRFDLSGEEALDDFEALASLKRLYDFQVLILTRRMLSLLEASGKGGEIENQFYLLSKEGQATLLDALSTSKRGVLLYRYRHSVSFMFDLLERMIVYRCSFKARKQIIDEFLSHLQSSGCFICRDFIQMIIEKQYGWGIYLLCSMNQTMYQSFFTIPAGLKSRFLNLCTFDLTTAEALRFLQTKGRERCLTSTSLELTNSVFELEAGHHDLKNTFNFLNSVELESLSICVPLIHQIPPIILGVAALKVGFQACVMRLIPFMSEEQVRFSICGLTDDHIEKFIRNHSGGMKKNSYFALIEALSAEQLKSFLKHRLTELSSCKDRFKELHLSFFDTALRAEENRYITKEEFQRLENQIMRMIALGRRPYSLMFQCISQFIDENRRSLNADVALSAICDVIEITSKDLLSRLSEFNDSTGCIAYEIKRMKTYLAGEEEVDLVETLYQGFWLMAREGTLPYLGVSPHSRLGITNLGELTILGIKGNDDLEYLGISPQAESLVEEILVQFELLVSVGIADREMKLEKISAARSYWTLLSRIGLQDSMTIDKLSLEATELLKIADGPLGIFFIQQCDLFFKTFLKFTLLDREEEDFLKEVIQQLSNQGKDSTAFLSGSIAKALIILRRQQPLFCLSRYLQQEEMKLKQVWEKLRAHGYESITSLSSDGLIEFSSDLLSLSKIAARLEESSLT